MATDERGEDGTQVPAEVLAAVVQRAGLGIALLGLDGTPVEADAGFCRIVGHDEAELRGTTLLELIHPDDVEHDEGLWAELLAGVRDSFSIETRVVRKDLRVLWCVLTLSAVRRPGGGLRHAVVLLEDVSERRRMQDELAQNVLHDSVTGLPTRRLFDDRLAHAQQLAQRSQSGVTVVALGIRTSAPDGPRPADDQVLVAAAERLTRACRDSDTLALVDDAEFAVLCEGADTAPQAAALAERLQSAVTGLLPLPRGGQARVLASVGFAVAGAAGGYDALLVDADAAMNRSQADAAGP